MKLNESGIRSGIGSRFGSFCRLPKAAEQIRLRSKSLIGKMARGEKEAHTVNVYDYDELPSPSIPPLPLIALSLPF